MPACASGESHVHHQQQDVSGSARADAVPVLAIVMPMAGAKMSNPAGIVIETDGDIDKLTMSAEKIGVHLHVAVDGRSVMPIREQLISVGGGRYAFIIDDPLMPGAHEISVYWADGSHKTIGESIQTLNIIAK